MIDGDGNPVTTPRNFQLQNVYLPIECPPGVQGHTFLIHMIVQHYHYCNGMFQSFEIFNISIIVIFIGGVDKPYVL